MGGRGGVVVKKRQKVRAYLGLFGGRGAESSGRVGSGFGFCRGQLAGRGLVRFSLMELRERGRE